MENMEDTDDGRDLRQTFRIDDQIELDYKLISEEEMSAPTYNPFQQTRAQSNLLIALAKIKEESFRAFRHVNKRHPEVARYFEFTDKKLDLIVEQLTTPDISNQLTMMPVNLSETGVSFETKEMFSNDTPLKVRMTLKPSLHTIQAYGRVVKCVRYKTGGLPTPVDELEEEGFRTALEFTHIQNSDRQFIARHIMYVQAQQRRTGL